MFGPHVDRVHAGGPGRPPLLAHIRAARAAALAADFDARAFQVFLAGPRNFSVTLRPEEAEELRPFLAGAGLFVVAHGTYMDFPWGDSPYPARFIRDELALCARAGVAGLVVHLGKTPPAAVEARLPSLAPPPGGAAPPRLYLETPAVKPENSFYETPEKLAVLFRAVRKVDPGLVGFGLCVDTAHLWSSGVDLRSYEDASGWLRRLEAVAADIPPDRIIFHLNDSFDARGSGRDEHAPLLRGKIWGEYADRPRQSGLAAFVDYAVDNRTPTILERKPKEELLGDYAAIARITPAVRPPPPGAAF